MKNVILIAIILLFEACHSPQNNENAAIDSAKVVFSDSAKSTVVDSSKVEKQYAYLKKIYQKDGVWLLDVDYIQFLMGDAAVIAARKKGDAIIDVDEKKDTTYSVPDDYYILNENKKIRTFELSSTAKVITLDVTTAGLGEHQGIEYLAKNLQKKTELPFILKIYQGKLVEVREQFVP